MAFGGGISLLALIAAGPGPAATAPAMMRVDFDAPAGCSSAEAFRRGVAARTDHKATTDGALAVRIQVRLTRNGNRVNGELRLTHAQAAPDTRTVEGATCDEVVDVLALTTALALQPATPIPAPVRAAPRDSAAAAAAARASAGRNPANPTTSGNPAPPPRAAREAPPLAAAPAPTATLRATAAAPAAPAPPAPEVAPSPSPRAARPPAAPPAPGAAAPLTTAVAPAPPSPAGPSTQVDIGAGAAGARILSSGPAVNLGSALMVGLARARQDRDDDRLAATLRLAWLYLPNDLLLSQGQVVDRWNAFVLTACPGWGLRRGPFEVQACARGIGGWLTATDRGVSNSRSVSRSWWSAGALLRGGAALGGGFSLELEAGVDAPLADRQFITTTPLRTVATTPPLSVLVGLGLSP